MRMQRKRFAFVDVLVLALHLCFCLKAKNRSPATATFDRAQRPIAWYRNSPKSAELHLPSWDRPTKPLGASIFQPRNSGVECCHYFGSFGGKRQTCFAAAGAARERQSRSPRRAGYWPPARPIFGCAVFTCRRCAKRRRGSMICSRRAAEAATNAGPLWSAARIMHESVSGPFFVSLALLGGRDGPSCGDGCGAPSCR